MIDFSDKTCLVISPHADDETLMAGGLLQKVKSSVVLPIAIGTTRSYAKGQVKHDTRWEELKNACSVYNDCKVALPFSEHDRYLYCKESVARCIEYIDNHISEFKPDIIVIPDASHHQDHRFTYEASIAACRPSVHTKDHLKMILIGAYPFSDFYPTRNTSFSHLYIPLDTKEANTKLAALSKHESQLTGNKLDAVSLESVSAIMRMRGAECMHEYAERFEILRMIV